MPLHLFLLLPFRVQPAHILLKLRLLIRCQQRSHLVSGVLPHRIKVHIGDAIELLSEQKQKFDIVFNDIDKEDYPRVLRQVSPRLKKGGLFVTDNVLWSARVVDPNATDARTQAIREFNRQLYKSDEFFTTVLPLRDGVAIAVKK